MENLKTDLKENQEMTQKSSTEDEQTANQEEEEIYQIYDRIFKRIFNMSSLAIINLVNALFGTTHSPESEIIYLNKEFVARNLDKRFADVFLQINGITYHLEAQMTKGKNIVLRVFEYGFYHAMENRVDGTGVLKFPEPVVIYLDTETGIPQTSELIIDFGEQGSFTYKVDNFVYQDHEIRELNQKKMVILIPFKLLKLRDIIEESPTPKNFAALQDLVLHGIIGSIKANLEVGNITEDDAEELKELTLQLYKHIYQHYDVLGGNSMKQLIEGAMELPGDKYRNEISDLREKIAEIEAKAEAEKAKAEAEKAKAEAEKAKAEAEKAKAEAEIQKLLKELEELKSR